MRLTAGDIRDMGLFKYYRLLRKWACDTYGLFPADLELLIYLDCKKRFSRKEFIDGTYTINWDKDRWERLRREGWIEVFREGDRKNSKGSIFKTSYKCKRMITRIYRIILGEIDLPVSHKSVYHNNNSYRSKTMNKAIDDMIKDKDR